MIIYGLTHPFFCVMLILNVSEQDATSWLARSRRGVRLIVIATVLLVARTCPKFHVELFWIEQLSGPPFLTYSSYSLSVTSTFEPPSTTHHKRKPRLKPSHTVIIADIAQTAQSNTTINRNDDDDDDDDDNNGKCVYSDLFFVISFYLLHYHPRERNPLNPYGTSAPRSGIVLITLLCQLY
jgi:hypothetical protein